jgi:hypothetical protein
MDLYTIKLTWKTFKVHMPDAEAYFRMSAGQHYAGNSASVDDLTLWFTKEPSEDTKLVIEAFWDGLSEAKEKVKVEQAQKLDRAEALARENIVNVDFPDMIVAEKKIFMGRPLSKEDREALLAKYPNA